MSASDATGVSDTVLPSLSLKIHSPDDDAAPGVSPGGSIDTGPDGLVGPNNPIGLVPFWLDKPNPWDEPTGAMLKEFAACAVLIATSEIMETIANVSENRTINSPGLLLWRSCDSAHGPILSEKCDDFVTVR